MWDDGLLNEQRVAASHFGSHARLLAGPGTGKTRCLTHRVLYLALERRVHPEGIVALTFTRAAAHELRSRIDVALGGLANARPRVSTVHSFALRNLLRNSDRLSTLPQPLRIADDWEERWIIVEDLKDIVDRNVRAIRDLFLALAADWETLAAEDPGIPRQTDPQFIGAWSEHRAVYGYTLRSELVYQLKRALEQIGDFRLESDFTQLLVDEYQDLNECDLAIIRALRDRGVEVFAAGDDDQSIYSFRHANPDGIRTFGNNFNPFKDLQLATCIRCDRAIIDFARFVARMDPRRIDKPLNPRADAGPGEVRLLRFDNQASEARGIARICKVLVQSGFSPSDFLVLIRSDRNYLFSQPLAEALLAQGLPVAVNAGTGSPLDENAGRMFLSILRLCVNREDHLAWRALLQLRGNGIGRAALSSVYQYARSSGVRLFDALRVIAESPSSVPRYGRRISEEWNSINESVDSALRRFISEAPGQEISLVDALDEVLAATVQDAEQQAPIRTYVHQLLAEFETTDLWEFADMLSASLADAEQELVPDRVNILTMHKAKGLTARAVVVAAAEDEYIPGRQRGEAEHEERRLLYVALTRARERLYITYCDRRTGAQRHTGRTSGQLRRSLTRFLRSAPVRAEPGLEYVARERPGQNV